MPLPEKHSQSQGFCLEATDLFGAHYSMTPKPYVGIDYSNKCFVFAGQGAIFPGMGKMDLQRFAVLQKRFAVADALAVQKNIALPSLYIENPAAVPADQLSVVQCLAHLTMSVGLFEVVLLAGEKPALVMGHSFGEYAALVASGIISFNDVFDIVCERDRLCRDFGNAGSMIAISATKNDVVNVLGSSVIANINSPQQVVVSVASADVKAVMEKMKRAKMAAKELDSIPQPYHSALLANASERLKDYIRNRNFIFQLPQVPMVSSVTGNVIDAANFKASTVFDVLAAQLTAPTDFVAQVKTAINFGCHHFIELAHNKIGSGWIADILAGQSYKVTVPAVLSTLPLVEKKKTGKAYDKKLVGFLNKIVSTVTGYSISEISLANNFQEDLGIDSIKKAQIVLNFLESQGDIASNIQEGMVMNQIRTIEDVLAWYTTGKSVAAARDVGSGIFSLYHPTWVDEPVLGIEKILARPVKSHAWVKLSEVYRIPQILREQDGCDAIIVYDDAAPFEFEILIDVFRTDYALFKRLPATFNLVFVTNCQTPPLVLAVEAFFKAVAFEIGFAARCIRFDIFDRDVASNIVLAELALPLRHTVRYVAGQRSVQRMLPRPKLSVFTVPQVVAAIGGSRGITRELVKTLMDKGTKYICVMGRRPHEDVQDDLQQLYRDGVVVDYVAGDCAVKEDLDFFITTALRYTGTIDLFIHGGGVEQSAPIPQQSRASVAAQVDVKTKATELIIDSTHHLPITKVVLFSSVAGEFGSPGQTVYAYANAAMTHLCEAANQTDALAAPRFQCIAWPAWNRVGMSGSEEIYRQLLLSGYRFLDASEGCRLFIEALSDKACDRLVCIDPGSQVDTIVPETATQALYTVFPNQDLLRFPIHLAHWTLDDIPDLRDHIVLDQPVVPMALCIATFFYAGFFKTGRVCRLENVKALSFMLLHQKDSPYFIDCRYEGSGLYADIRSNEPHISCQLLPIGADDVVAPVYQKPDLLEPLDFGPNFNYELQNFRIIDSGGVGADGRAYVDMDFTRQTKCMGSDPIHFLTMLIEAMLQLGGTIARRLVYKDSAPFSMDKIVINDAAARTDIYYIVVESQKVSDDLVMNNLYAYNSNNQPFIIITGEHVRLWRPAHEG